MSNKTLDKENMLRQKLIDVAAKVFAEKGFSHATIRDICMQADANIAAVNYYWGDKKKLYERVIEELIIKKSRIYPLTVAMDDSLSPEERLRKFIELFLYRLLDSEQPSWSGKIMIREITQPTESITLVLDKLIKPTFDVLNSIVCAIRGDGVPQDKIKLAVVSIISQCVFYVNSANIRDKLVEKELLPEFKMEEVIDHITDFSFKALVGN
jgi:TetR/AcrR family transcriptional regulator, regulator of cefoperazone and chloramphenicol sensitivity